ncbi:hypothetical protein C8F04DRAFT_1232760 [Mycena alexandri]|uniref:Uncharacterized protein n=1 Tax=Mycena alexandri TaxID=1745969 RepID=A0AAD6X6S8_9AGAR|nr:hypothetical protein C8F04DRAFT_1232760 [Mycena alexandri]
MPPPSRVPTSSALSAQRSARLQLAKSILNLCFNASSDPSSSSRAVLFHSGGLGPHTPFLFPLLPFALPTLFSGVSYADVPAMPIPVASKFHVPVSTPSPLQVAVCRSIVYTLHFDSDYPHSMICPALATTSTTSRSRRSDNLQHNRYHRPSPAPYTPLIAVRVIPTHPPPFFAGTTTTRGLRCVSVLDHRFNGGTGLFLVPVSYATILLSSTSHAMPSPVDCSYAANLLSSLTALLCHKNKCAPPYLSNPVRFWPRRSCHIIERGLGSALYTLIASKYFDLPSNETKYGSVSDFARREISFGKI